MSVNYWTRPLFPVFVLSVVFSGLIVSAVAGQDEPVEPRQPNRFDVYARKVFQDYDKNKDGYLSAKEMESMDGALVDKRFDVDSDGKISLAEMAKAVQRPSSPKVRKDRAADFGNDVARTYFMAILKKHDVDGDGLLSADEAKGMRKPLRKGVDANSDGKVSLDELMVQWKTDLEQLPTAFSQEKETKAKPAADKVVAASTTPLDTEQLYLRFLTEAMNHNDRNRNGQLDPDEIRRAMWSTSWQDSDSNGDGILSRSELKARYKAMFAEMLDQKVDQNATHVADKQKTAPNSKSAAIYGAMSSDGKGGMIGGMMGGQADGDALAKLLGGQRRSSPASSGYRGVAGNSSRATRASADDSRPLPLHARVAIDVYLLRASNAPDIAALDALLDSIKTSSPGKLAGTIAKLAGNLGAKNYDHLAFTAIDGEETKITTGSEVSVVMGTTTGRNGIKTELLENRDVGLDAEIRPQIYEGHVSLEINLSKSDVIESEKQANKTPLASSVRWEYSSRLRVDDGSLAVISSSANGQRWILVARTKVLDHNRTESKRRR